MFAFEQVVCGGCETSVGSGSVLLVLDERVVVVIAVRRERGVRVEAGARCP